MLKLTTLAMTAVLAAEQAIAAPPKYDDIQTVVVIYAENRSFDNLYGGFPGANGLVKASKTSIVQLDRDGKPMLGLPAIWGGTGDKVMQGAPVAPAGLTEGQTSVFLKRFNHPYDVAALYHTGGPSDADPLRYTNRDLWHRFYENQMQINGGANNMFAAWADSGGMTMGYFNPASKTDQPLWAWAHRYVLADNFFQGAFGGSFLNHFFLICSCAPYYGHDGHNPNGGKDPSGSIVKADGVTLVSAPNSPASALDGPPVFAASGSLTPDFYAVNTMMPPYAPSGNADAEQKTVDMKSATTLVPQTETTIGDLLSKAGVGWAYYAGGWDFALSHPPFAAGSSKANPNFQYHHQPFDYFAAFDPARRRRARPIVPLICWTRRGGRPGCIAGLAVLVGHPRRQTASGDVLQTARFGERACILCQCRRRRPPHRDVADGPAGQPAVEPYAGRGYLRRIWRLVGPRRATEG